MEGCKKIDTKVKGQAKAPRRMQRQIIDGIPYYIDSQNRVYNWDTEASPQHIGTYDAASKRLTFLDNHLTPLADRLQEWRAVQQPRFRKQAKDSATNSTSGGNSNSSAASTENSEDE
jgi:hypothetical protein